MVKFHNKCQQTNINTINLNNKTKCPTYSIESTDTLHKANTISNTSNIKLPIPHPKLYRTMNNNIYHINKQKPVNNRNIDKNSNINQTTTSPIIWTAELIKNSLYITRNNSIKNKPKVTNIIDPSYTNPIHVPTLKHQNITAPQLIPLDNSKVDEESNFQTTIHQKDHSIDKIESEYSLNQTQQSTIHTKKTPSSIQTSHK